MITLMKGIIVIVSTLGFMLGLVVPLALIIIEGSIPTLLWVWGIAAWLVLAYIVGDQ